MLKALLIKFLTAVHTLAPVQVHTAPVITAIVTVTQDPAYVPIFGSPEIDAFMFAYTGWAESNMRLHAVGDHGTAFGVYQLHMEAGKGDALMQTRALVQHLRWDLVECPELPMAAFLSGNCKHARRMARTRMWAVMEALVKSGIASPSAVVLTLVRFPHGTESLDSRCRLGRSRRLPRSWRPSRSRDWSGARARWCRDQQQDQGRRAGGSGGERST